MSVSARTSTIQYGLPPAQSINICLEKDDFLKKCNKTNIRQKSGLRVVYITNRTYV